MSPQSTHVAHLRVHLSGGLCLRVCRPPASRHVHVCMSGLPVPAWPASRVWAQVCRPRRCHTWASLPPPGEVEQVSACISATRAPTLQSLPCLCTQGGDPRTCLSACTSLVLVRGDTRGGAVSPYIGRAHVWLHMRVCLCHGFTVFSCAGLDALPSFRSLLRSPCTFTHTLLFAFSLPFLRGPRHRAPPRSSPSPNHPQCPALTAHPCPPPKSPPTHSPLSAPPPQ